MFDTALAIKHLRSLSFPRRTGSAGEREVVSYVSTALREAGLDPNVETFQFGSRLHELGWRFLPLLLSLPVLLAAILLPVSPAFSGALAVLSAAGLLQSGRWRVWVERLYDSGPRLSGSNVVATLDAEPAGPHQATLSAAEANAEQYHDDCAEASDSPASPRGSSDQQLAGDSVWDVIVIAHYDSKSHTIPLGPRMLLFILHLALVAVSIVMVLSAAYLGSSSRHSASMSARTAAIAAVGISAILALGSAGNKSPGALDNAAGVGVMLTIAAYFAENRPRNTRMTFLASGAEEEGLVGAVRFLQRHESDYDPRSTFVINYDMPGVGSKVVLVGSSGLLPCRAGRAIKHIARVAARKAEVRVASATPLLGAGMDHIPFLARGFEAIGLMGQRVNRPVFLAHSRRDVLAGIEPEAIGHAGLLGVAMIETIDELGGE